MKRVFDIVISSVGLVIISPLLFFVIILIKVDSKGPAFFCQERVGKNSRRFNLYKFRTMSEDASTLGPSLTHKNDMRITRAGKILRWLKVDELPQLINIIKGDMSFVGPRPEIPSIVIRYSKEDRKILSVQPGLVGPSQIQWRHEVEMYPDDSNPEEYYLEHILPVKLRADLDYVEDQSFWKDLKLFLSGISITIIGALGIRSNNKRKTID